MDIKPMEQPFLDQDLRDQLSISTVSGTWITPLLWYTSQMLMLANRPFGPNSSLADDPRHVHTMLVHHGKDVGA